MNRRIINKHPNTSLCNERVTARSSSKTHHLNAKLTKQSTKKMIMWGGDVCCPPSPASLSCCAPTATQNVTEMSNKINEINSLRFAARAIMSRCGDFTNYSEVSEITVWRPSEWVPHTSLWNWISAVRNSTKLDQHLERWHRWVVILKYFMSATSIGAKEFVGDRTVRRIFHMLLSVQVSCGVRWLNHPKGLK